MNALTVDDDDDNDDDGEKKPPAIAAGRQVFLDPSEQPTTVFLGSSENKQCSQHFCT